MGFYQDQILPIVIDMAMRQRNLAPYRSRSIPDAPRSLREMRRVLEPAGVFCSSSTAAHLTRACAGGTAISTRPGSVLAAGVT
jgi:hypothetical protein